MSSLLSTSQGHKKTRAILSPAIGTSGVHRIHAPNASGKAGYLFYLVPYRVIIRLTGAHQNWDTCTWFSANIWAMNFKICKLNCICFLSNLIGLCTIRQLRSDFAEKERFLWLSIQSDYQKMGHSHLLPLVLDGHASNLYRRLPLRNVLLSAKAIRNSLHAWMPLYAFPIAYTCTCSWFSVNRFGINVVD